MTPRLDTAHVAADFPVAQVTVSDKALPSWSPRPLSPAGTSQGTYPPPYQRVQGVCTTSQVQVGSVPQGQAAALTVAPRGQIGILLGLLAEQSEDRAATSFSYFKDRPPF